MIYVKKKHPMRKAALLLLILAVLGAGLLILINNLPKKEDPTDPPKYEQLPWEGTGNRAYAAVSTSAVDIIEVNGGEHPYALIRDTDGNYYLRYTDENGETKIYNPDILAADAAFDFKELYATTPFGAISMPKLMYLRQAVSSVTFAERVDLGALDDTARGAFLASAGLAGDGAATVRFHYTNEDGTAGSHTVKVGNVLVNGTGYYVMIADTEQTKNYVYATSGTYLSYALMDYTDYIAPNVVSKGLATDGVYEPYLTTSFKEWHSTLHDTDGEAVAAGARVTVRLTESYPYGGSIYTSAQKKASFDLSALADKAAMAPLSDLLSSSVIGDFPSPVTLVLPASYDNITLPESGAVDVVYHILTVDGAITDGVENAAAGTPVGSADSVRVSYTEEREGSLSDTLYAVLDLSDASLDASDVSALRAAAVGDTGLTVRASYSRAVSESHSIRMVLSEIVAIYDPSYRPITVAAEDSVVTYAYSFSVDGVLQDEVHRQTLNLSDTAADIRSAFVGKSAGAQTCTLTDYTEYCTAMSDYLSYTVFGVEGFYTRELVVSFRFQNYSERDPYYGESIYENRTPGQNLLYGLNNGVCEGIVKLLGGVGDDTTASVGFKGERTVAVGLSEENMERYHLYDNVIYFELPRGIVDSADVAGTETSSDDVIGSISSSASDYIFYGTLGFTIYISDKNPDGSRYIASDMYDVVALVTDSAFDFLDGDFLDTYARRILILTDVGGIEDVKLETFMDDLFGEYDFALTHKTYYNVEGVGMVDSVVPGDIVVGTYDQIRIRVTPGTDAFETDFLRFFTESGNNSLVTYYNALNGGQVSAQGNDFTGTAYFKSLLRMMYLTHYTGELTAEQKDLTGAPLLSRMTFRLTGTPFSYVFSFYRVSERRVAVQIHRADGTGTQVGESVCDFFISEFAFGKIMNGYLNVLNGKEVNSEVPYAN